MLQVLRLKTKLIIVAVVLALVMVFTVVALMVLTVLGVSSDDAERATYTDCNVAGSPGTIPKAPKGTHKQQLANVKAIDEATREAGLSGRATRIAAVTAMGESSLLNLDYGDQRNGVRNPDGSLATSFGLYQQQTSQGWGTKAQVMDPSYATLSFLKGPKHDGSSGLVTIDGWEQTSSISRVINKVQRNKDPDHYTKFLSATDDLLTEAKIDIHRPAKGKAENKDAEFSADRAGQITVDDLCADPDAMNAVTVGDLGSGEWRHPLPKSRETSPYGPRPCPAGADCNANTLNHRGQDFSTGGGAEVVAPTDMKITMAVKGDSGAGLSQWYGTFIVARQIDSPRLVFEFHHLAHGSLKVKAGDTVAAGTPIGIEGSTGNSTGAHLHFQINDPSASDSQPSPTQAIDPMPILKAKGVL